MSAKILRALYFVFAHLLAVAAILGTTGYALAEKRVAVVIGNDAYANLPPEDQLRKAVNDARAVGDALASIGFDVVRGENLGRAAMIDKIEEATSKLERGDVVFFFFAGHGVSLKNGNYVLPADIPNIAGGREARLANQAIAEADIIASLQEPGTRVTLVVLDACRNNPFSKPGMRAIGTERGLARAPEAEGLFSLYSSGLGQTALDRLGDDDANANSVFSRVLVPRLTEPGLSLDSLAKAVRDEVAKTAESVHHKQVPAIYNQIQGGDFYLVDVPAVATNAPAATPEVPVKPPLPTTKPSADDAAIARAFETVKALDMAEGYDAFIQQYPGTLYAKLAAQLKVKLGTKPAEGPKTEPEVEKPTVKTATAIADLKGRWSGAVVCRNRLNYSVDMTILTQSGKTAKGEVHWTGSNTGRDTVSIAPNPAAETPDGYLIVTSNPQAYDYFVTVEGNVLRGQSTGSERCSVTLER